MHLPKSRIKIEKVEEKEIKKLEISDLFEIKRVIQIKEFQDSLSIDLADKVRSIFAGCGCHMRQKILDIFPEIKGALDAFTQK